MTDEAKALVERLRDRGVCSIAQNSCRNDYVCDAAADLIETQAREIDRLKAEVDGLRDLLVRGYVVCDGDDEDAVAFRNDAHAALAGDSHDQ